MSGRRGWLVGLAVFVVVAAALVVVLVVVVKGKDQTGRPKLTAQEQHGRQLFARTCGRCHTLRATNSVGDVGPDLDTWDPYGIPPGVVVGAVEDGRRSTYSNATMPAGLLGGSDAEAVAAFVAKVTAIEARRRGGPPPLDWRRPVQTAPVQTTPAPSQTPPRSPDEPQVTQGG